MNKEIIREFQNQRSHKHSNDLETPLTSNEPYPWQSVHNVNVTTHITRDPFVKPVPDGRNDGRVQYISWKSRNWKDKYLYIFSRTWVALLLASVVCCSVAQPIVSVDQSEEVHNKDFTFERNHLNNNNIFHHHHHLSVSQNIHRHNESKYFLDYRHKLQNSRHHRHEPGYPNLQYESYHSTKQKPQSSGRTSDHLNHNLSRNKELENHGKHSNDPRLIRKYSERKPRTLIANNFHHQKDRHSNENVMQSDSGHPEEDGDEIIDNGKPCVYSGHLKTDRNWYGYLANISLAGGTGRLVFEFSYPADSCCLSILFYYEDQLSIMSARTNCWQKEDLLRPDVDQILRLTPSFSWSGCQVKKRTGGDTMVCKGGRSFTKHSYDFHSGVAKERPEADDKMNQRQHNSDTASNAAVWYVAVSHCASLRGLNLRYKLKVYGHSVPCNADYGGDEDNSSDRENHMPSKNLKQSSNHKSANDSNRKDDDIKQNNLGPSSSSSSTFSSSSSTYQSHRPSDAAQRHLASDEWPVCTIEGSVNTTHSWFGFIKNLSLVDGGGFRFYFSLPYSMSPMNVLLYHDEDIRKLHWEQICWLKDSVIESKHVLERIIDLTSRSMYNGCASKTGANIEGNNLTCRGEKIFTGDRNIYIALSNCRSRDGLLLKYKLDVFGYKDQTLCSSDRHVHLDKIKMFFLFFVFRAVFIQFDPLR